MDAAFEFRAEGRDSVHTFVGVYVGATKTGQLCFLHEEWEALRERVLAPAGEAVTVKEYEPWPGE